MWNYLFVTFSAVSFISSLFSLVLIFSLYCIHCCPRFYFFIPVLCFFFMIFLLYHRERILKSSTLSCNEEKEEITKLSQNEGAHPFYEGAPPLFWVLFKTNKHPSTFQISPPPTCLQHQLIPPPPLYLGQGGTTQPSTPFLPQILHCDLLASGRLSNNITGDHYES